MVVAEHGLPQQGRLPIDGEGDQHDRQISGDCKLTLQRGKPQNQIALAQLLGDEACSMQFRAVLDDRERYLIKGRGQAVNTEGARRQLARGQGKDAELGRSGDDFGDGAQSCTRDWSGH